MQSRIPKSTNPAVPPRPAGTLQTQSNRPANTVAASRTAPATQAQPGSSSASASTPANTAQDASSFGAPVRKPSRVEVRNDLSHLHSQQGAPPMAAASNSRPPTELKMDNVSCLTHGMHASHVEDALKNGRLSSAYHREGANGHYSRDSDKRGGGALGVYTRAVGTEQTQWPAQGHGVGSNADKVQMILSPNMLQQSGHSWRASSTDIGGRVPGSTPTDLKNTPQGSPLNAKPLWSKQTESGRNYALNESVTGPIKQNNEQVHWEKVPLQGNLKGMVCNSQASFDQMMRLPGAKPSMLPMPQGLSGLGSVVVGNERVPIAFASGNSSLSSTMRLANIADSNNRVR